MSVFEIVIYKKRENRWKALYIGKQNDFTRNVYNVCFIISQELQGKKRKNSCICRCFLDTKMLKLMNNILNWDTEQVYQMRVFSVFFKFLVTKTPNCMRNQLYVGKKWHYQKNFFWVFLSVLGNKPLKSRGSTLHGNKTKFYQELPLKCFWSLYIPKR